MNVKKGGKFIRKSHYSSPSNSLYWFVQLWKKLTLLIPKWGATLPIQVGLLKLSPQVREASYQMDSPAPPKVWLCNITNDLSFFCEIVLLLLFFAHSRKVRLMDRNQAAFIIDTSEPFHSSIHWIGRHKITSIFAHFLGQLHFSMESKKCWKRW